MMNHDYAHCLDFQNSCPASCFRAKLSRDLEKRREEYIKIPLTWSFFRQTEYCPLGNSNKGCTDD